MSTEQLLAPVRLERVLELLQSRGLVQVSELATEFGVSEVTVRSDLALLARRGLIARVRGGARALQRGQSEVAFEVRLRLQSNEKRAIARAAADMVSEGETIALDPSTTAYYIAIELRSRHELVVITNGLLVASALADAPGVSVVVLGGVLRHPAMSLVGDFADAMLRAAQINHGFFGARGVSIERGLMDLDPAEAKLKAAMTEVCQRVVGAFDSSKWLRTGFLAFAPADKIHAIVTDAKTPPELVERWRDRGVEVVTAEVDHDLPPSEWVHGLRRQVPPSGAAS